MKTHQLKYLLIPVFSIALAACETLFKVPSPKNEITASLVFEDDGMARSAVSGIYAQIMGGSGALSGGVSSLTTLCGLYADELDNQASTTDMDAFYYNRLLPTNSTLMNGLWKDFYQTVSNANAAIEGLSKAGKLSPSMQKQLLGEVLFVRALAYFYLTNLFGDVPLALTTDYRVNNTLSRSSKDLVYAQIVADLTEAEKLLSAESPTPVQRIFPGKWAAAALLARTYLYTGNYSGAIQKSGEIINNKDLFTLSDNLMQTFKNTSKEIIWQLKPVVPGQNSTEAVHFIPVTATSATSRSISQDLLDSFAPSDKRKGSWTGSATAGGKQYYYPFKYQVKTSSPLQEYYVILRLSEQYLIRAEASASNGDLARAGADLNVIRAKSGLAPLEPTDQALLLEAITTERRHEFFAELGHRFLDLKRTGTLDAVMSKLKQTWSAHAALFPIPDIEITNNPNLLQNEGYQ